MIPYGRQEITDTDIAEVKKVLRSDFLTQGPIVPKFEKAMTNYCGASYAIAANSATSALHIACLALDLGPQDLLWTSPNTFVASANCGRYCGADIDFVDIDPNTYNMSVDALSEKLIRAKKLGKLPKVVVPVHFAGQPCDMIKIHELSKHYGFKTIEDASHAVGASYNEFKVGSCAYSDITVFSFHPVKIITTAEGGMALTNDKSIADKISRLRTHGITNDKDKMKQRPKNEIWNYQQIDLGFNYRMNDIEASLGSSQITNVSKWISIRNSIAKKYIKNLKNLPISFQNVDKNNLSSYHLFIIQIKSKNKNINRNKLFYKMKSKGINVNVHYIPIYRHSFYKRMGFNKNHFENSEYYYKHCLSLPIYPSLTNKDFNKIIKVLRNYLI